MASWQAHVAVWLLKLSFKRRLAHAPDVGAMRKVMTPPRFRVPQDVTLNPAEVGGVPGEWLRTADGGPSTLLYVHGGGYFACSAKGYRPITAGFAQQGFRVFAPEYRLAPEHPFPAALDDVLAVYRGLLAQGLDAGQISLGGDSAGGGLALATVLALRDSGNPLPAAVVLFSPWTDLAGTGDSLRFNDRRCAMFYGESIPKAADLYLRGQDARNPLASPLYAELAGLPPLLIHVGSDEVLLDDSRRLADRARAAGVPVDIKIWPVVSHAWQLGYPMVPEARQSIQEASAFIKSLPARGMAA